MNDFFGKIARGASQALGHPLAFILALLGVIAWAAAGPAFHYSENWQLVINTGTTILTFLMLFLIQNSQNRDSTSVGLKLDELLRAMRGARNDMIGLESLSEAEIQRYKKELHDLHTRFQKEWDARQKERQADEPNTTDTTA